MSIKSFFSNAWVKLAIKLGLKAYESKNDNEFTNTVVDAVEETLDIADEETEE